MQPGKLNAVRQRLIEPAKLLLPPLHIKLGLVKQFMKALDHGGEAFQEIRLLFPKLSEAKIKGGTQVRKILKSAQLENAVSDTEREPWCAFRDIVNGYLGNKKAPKYKQLVGKLLESYKNLDCRMSLKVLFLHSHLDFFRENLGEVSEKQGERFHHDIAKMEKRYQGR